ncbi:hypothetical protein BBJ28_00008593, partial [Nothophytophthora sp. Chile5]
MASIYCTFDAGHSSGTFQEAVRDSQRNTSQLPGSAMNSQEDDINGLPCGPSPLQVADALDSVAILETFLLEMNELDRQQQERTVADADGSKRQKREKEEMTEVTPQPQKKTKTGGVKDPTPRKNPSWRRRKQELQSLRQQTQAMETRAAFLQLQRRREQLRVDATANLSDGQKQWRSAAVGEQQRRHEAEDENRRLKVQLQTYVRVTGDLQTVLTAAQALHTAQRMSSSTIARSLRAQIGTAQRLQLGSSSMFDMLESRVNARFLQIGAILQELLQPMTAADNEEIRICREDDDGMSKSVKFTRERLLPFDEGTTSNVLWELIKLGRIPDEQCSRVTRRSEDVFALDTRNVVPLACGGTITLDVHCVIKR